MPFVFCHPHAGARRLNVLYKLSGRADGWACLHAQTYAYPEANRYEQGAMRKAQGESANTG